MKTFRCTSSRAMATQAPSLCCQKNPDKAQIYYISSKAAGELKEGYTPRMVCEYIVNEMQADIDDIKGPVLNILENRPSSRYRKRFAG